MSNEFARLAERADDMARELSAQENDLLSRETGVQMWAFIATLCKKLEAEAAPQETQDEDEKEIEKQFQDRAEAFRGRHPGISDEAIRNHLRKELENQKGRD